MKKNGFTLIELIAVIVILLIILTLSVPSLIGALKTNKEKSLEKVNELVILAAKNYVVDYQLQTPRDISLSELCKSYLDCPIKNPITNDDMNISIRVDSNRNYSILNNELIELKVILNGGKLSKDISGGHVPNSEVMLENPKRDNQGFGGWEVVSGDAVINGNVLKLGNKDSTITANWLGIPIKLSVNLDGGTSSTTFKSEYYAKDILDLGSPTRSGYVFSNWKIESGNAVISGTKLTFGLEDVSVRAVWIKSIYGYAYAGKEQTFTAPLTGYYKFEAWGAQGGSATGGTNGGTITGVIGGYGGYSTGIYYLTKGTKLYINVGGMGKSNQTTTGNGTFKYLNGGYNGGGKATVSDYYGFAGSGGGATHIAKVSGLLSTLSSKKDNIVIVAGGGGGAMYYNYNSAGKKGMGGSGGGFKGASGYLNTAGTNATTAGTQTTGAGFGTGGVSSSTSGNVYHAGGGAGLYGGAVGTINAGAAGGSGYIGNSLLTNKVMYCYNCTTSGGYSYKTVSTTCTNSSAKEKCSKQGNGYAKISYIQTSYTPTYFTKNNYEEMYYNGKEQIFTAPLTGYYKLEVWGAQGGAATGGTNGGTITGVIGGYGGYSAGTYYLTKGTKLYINVGGMGKSNQTTTGNGTFKYLNGGYNGGGKATVSDYYGFAGSGGGATHIAKVSGLLSTLSSKKDNIIIVAGGGGGAMYYNYNSAGKKGMGGSGGGFKGTSGYLNTVGTNATTAGTQTTGAGFGTGGVSSSTSGNVYHAGGGAGLYGGAVGTNNAGAAGGSGYIGNSLLTNKVMYCYNCTASTDASTKTISTTCTNGTATANCSKKGNGHAKITYNGV